MALAGEDSRCCMALNNPTSPPTQAPRARTWRINSFHGRAIVPMPASAPSVGSRQLKLETPMLARWICASLTAALLAALVIASGSEGSSAAESGTAIFAGGCFWCMEAAFDEVDGVTETISGYAGGTAPDPTYGQHAGYQESVRVTYDPSKVSYAKLLDRYWHNVDPFDPEGQFCDKGEAY